MATLEKTKAKTKKKIDRTRVKVSDKLGESSERLFQQISNDAVENLPDAEASENPLGVMSDTLGERHASSQGKNLETKEFKECAVIFSDNLESTPEMPTAPVCNEYVNESKQQPTEKSYLAANKALLNTIQLDEIALVTAKQPIEQPTVTMEMNPYTETQLEAFYRNDEIALATEFTKQFVDSELRGTTIQQHPLNQLLTDYLAALSKAMIKHETQETKSEYEECQKSLHHIRSVTYKSEGQCSDSKTLTVSQTCDEATLDENQMKKLRTLFNKLERLKRAHVLQSFLVQSLRLYIEDYVKRLCENAAQRLIELRMAVSVLFSFQRRLVEFECFVKETREWLTYCVRTLYRFATWQDHLFVLNHLLRCPAGVGNWGACFVQPEIVGAAKEDAAAVSPFADVHLNHVVATLALILKPVDKRDVFLQHFCAQPDTGLWVVVDSDGEEDSEITSLRENDLVAFLNQIPLDKVFCRVLRVQTKDDSRHFDPDNVNDEHHVLRLLAFCNALLKLFCDGLRTYGDIKYHQFSKRLCRIANHTLQYVTDVWEQLKVARGQTADGYVDAGMLKRLDVEYDAFIDRAVKALLATETLAALQFLSIVPFGAISSHTLWHIFRSLRSVGCSTSTSSIRDVFIERLIDDMTEAEAVYLINVFANMALARTETDDDDFIRTVAFDLLHIGFVNMHSADSFWKNVQNLLVNLCIRFPFLLSEFLVELQQNPVHCNCLKLYEQLPLNVWRFSERDMQILSSWLLSDSQVENSLSRMIFSRLNYAPENVTYDFQIKIALKILDYNVKNGPQNQNADVWCWQMLKRMRLHLTDRGCLDGGGGVTDWSAVKDVEFYASICSAIKEKHPLALFLSILITSHGHLVPLILSKGMEHLDTLLIMEKNGPLLFALSVTVPVFLNSQETIINHGPFQNLLQKMIKRSQILDTWTQMIVSQICASKNPKNVIRLWFNSLLSVANWYRERGALVLLDSLLENCFFWPDCLHMVLKEMRLHMVQINEQISAENQYGFFSKFLGSNPNLPLDLSANPYISYLVVKSEFLEREWKTGLWNDILVQLNRQTGKISVDNAIKKAANSLKIVPFYSSSLSLYRWSQLALEIPAEHPLLPLVWQEFFILYLQRVSVSVHGSVTVMCVGDKFFSGVINQNLFKKMKTQLLETVKVHQNDAELHRLFHAYSLWLQEPRLQEANIYLAGLPVQYEPTLLAQLFQGPKLAPWFQYVRLSALEKVRRERIQGWSRFCNRVEEKTLKAAQSGSKTDESVSERVVNRLSSYDVPLILPVCQRDLDTIPLTENPKQYLKMLLQFSDDFSARALQDKKLNTEYEQLVPNLYKTFNLFVKKRLCCGPQCTGSTEIRLSLQQSELQEPVQRQMQLNRAQFDLLLSQSLQPVSFQLCLAGAILENCKVILKPEKALEMYYELIRHLNQQTLSCPLTAHVLKRTLDALARIYVTDNGQEQWKLLQLLVKEPERTDRLLLIEHFKPESGNFLLMYEVVCEKVKKIVSIPNSIHNCLKTILALLLKFRVDFWLRELKPKLAEISKFVDLILECIGGRGVDGENEEIWAIFKTHLMHVFMHRFPEHYGEIIMKLLNFERSGDWKAQIWSDLISALLRNSGESSSQSKAAPNPSHSKLLLQQTCLRQYANAQKLLRYDIIVDTTILFAKHFSQQRLKQTFGLYQKYRGAELDALSTFMSMTSHALVVSALNVHKSELANKICEMLWPHLRDMYSPWIVPTTIKTDTVLPWIPDDQSQARKIIEPFFQTVNFLLETLPACNILLNYIWQWYCTYFTHPNVQESYINDLVHPDLMALCWHRFHPNVSDLEHMFKVVEMYLPECHVVLGSVFVQITWNVWLRQLLSAGVLDARQINRVHQCLLTLLVKLSNEPNVRQNFAAKEAVKVLLVQMEQFDWGIYLDSQVYQQICDWYVVSCDPTVVFCTDPTDLDFRVLDLLRKIGEGDANAAMHQCFFKCFLKLVGILVAKNKSLVESKRKDLDEVLLRHLMTAEKFIVGGATADVVMADVLNLVVKINGSRRVLRLWLEKSNETVLLTALRNVWQLNDLDLVAELHETILSALFNGSFSDVTAVTGRLQARNARDLERIFVQNGHVLSLYATALDRVKHESEDASNFNTIISWLKDLKVVDEALIETKLPLLWSLSLKLCRRAESDRFGRFVDYLTDARQDRSWAPRILGAIGMSKQESKFKFMCRALESFLNWRLACDSAMKQAKVEFGFQGGVSNMCFQAIAKRVWDSALTVQDSDIFLYELASQLYSKPYFNLIQSVQLQ